MKNTEGLVHRSPMKLNISTPERSSSQNPKSAKMDTILRYGTLIILVLQTTATVSQSPNT